jgi:type VI secretion system secreted protein VgrG
MEVIVSFLEGDPDQPLVTGCVYNADTMPPYALPDNKTISGMKSSSSKGGAGFNEIRFEDKAGEEQIFIHAQKNQDNRVLKDCFEWIGNDRHLIVVNDQIEEIKNDRHEKVKNDNIVEIGRDDNLKVIGKQAIEVGESQSVKVKGKVIEEYTGNHSEKCDADIYLKAANICIEADTNITIKVGGSYIAIESGGIKIETSGEIEVSSTQDTKFKAMNWKAEAQMEFGTKGMMVKSEGSLKNEVLGVMTDVKGDAMLTLKGGITMIN